jgi:hypothetical protein
MAHLRSWIDSGRPLIRWALWGGALLWILLFLEEVAAPRPNVDRAVQILILGGAVLSLLRWALRWLDRQVPRRTRADARAALLRDPTLSKQDSRSTYVSWLLGRDAVKMRAFPWADRIPPVVEGLLAGMSRSADPLPHCRQAMMRCLALLYLGRSHWRPGDGAETGDPSKESGLHSLRDEEALQYLLVVLVLLSSLFRLHLARWGPPKPPFTQRLMARLRGSWMSFCLMEPTPRMFPPALPDPMESALRERNERVDSRGAEDLAAWIFRGEPDAISRFVTSLLGETSEEGPRTTVDEDG